MANISLSEAKTVGNTKKDGIKIEHEGG